MNKLIEIIEILQSFSVDPSTSVAVAEKIESSGLLGIRLEAKWDDLPEFLKKKTEFKVIQDSILEHPNKSQFSDGYHSFEELYSIRLAYNVALFNEWGRQHRPDKSGRMYLSIPVPKHDVHKSQRHHDGELCFGGGWFIVVANLPSGQISNHYEMKHWDLFRVPAVEKAKYEWDGHTSEDVINRLKSL